MSVAMLKSCTTPVLRAIWRGREPQNLHPRVLFAVRQHLSILHAAVDLEDLHQALGQQLEGCYDPSVPFPEDPTDAVPAASPTSPDWWRIHVGYGWYLSFSFEAGEARRVGLHCGEQARPVT